MSLEISDKIMFSLGAIGFIFLISIFMWIPWDLGNLFDAEKKSCEKLGMEYLTVQDSEFCVDTNGNAHFVKIDCDKVAWNKYDCIPQIITIGDIRLK